MIKQKSIVLDVKKIASLAHLSLTDKELELYKKQFKKILSYIGKLNKLNTEGIEPTFQVLDKTENILREDKIRPSLTQKESLANATNTYKGYFVADHVFGDNKDVNKHSGLDQTKPLQDNLGAILTKANTKGSVGHKDLFCTKGITTTAGSKLLANFIPPYSATIVKKLNKLGLKTKYKLNQDAWGHGSSGENSDFFPTKNPFDIKRVAGGSSSGSAVATAIGEVDISTGTDTCGSIRLPASFCNVLGFKPTYGALSRSGVIAFASSLDCPGLLATSAKKILKIYRSIAVRDPLDATSHSKLRKNLDQNKPIKTIGIPREMFTQGIDKNIKKTIQNAIDVFKSQGIKTYKISLPHADLALAAYYLIAPVEAASNLARYDGVRFGSPRSYFGAEAKRRIMLGTFASSAGYADKYYEKAAQVRTLIIKDFNKAWETVDAIFAPVSPSLPFLIGEKASDPLKLYLMDIYAAPASLAGLPALSIPCGFVDNLPVGIQLIGPRWSGINLLKMAQKYQDVTDYHKKKPNR